jgi:MFS family permease
MHWLAMVVWVVALFVAGFGVGIAWPHLSAWIMGAAGDDPVQGSAAAAAINTVQLISGAFGAGLAGVVVNMAHGGDAAAARWLFGVFAALAAIGILAAHKSRPR